jgi:hypothetical protein
LSRHHRGAAHDRGNSAAYLLLNFHEKGKSFLIMPRHGRAPPASPRMALTVTTHHSVNGIGRRLTMVPPQPWVAERPNRLRLLQLLNASVALPSSTAP